MGWNACSSVRSRSSASPDDGFDLTTPSGLESARIPSKDPAQYGRHVFIAGMPLPRNITVAWALKRRTFAFELFVLMLRMAILPRAVHAIREIKNLATSQSDGIVVKKTFKKLVLWRPVVQFRQITLAEV